MQAHFFCLKFPLLIFSIRKFPPIFLKLKYTTLKLLTSSEDTTQMGHIGFEVKDLVLKSTEILSKYNENSSI